MITCRICRRAVTKSRLAMFEHIFNYHALEVLTDPRKLASLANLSPAESRELAAEFGRSLLRSIHAKKN